METITKARELLDQGQAQESYRELSRLFGRIPDVLELRADFCAAMEILGELTRGFGDGELALLIGSLAVQPDDAGNLFEAAYQLYEQCQYPAACTILLRANRLYPGEAELVSELVSNLHELLLYREAAEALDASGTCHSELVCAYLSGYSHLMSGQLEAARERLSLLRGDLSEPLTVMRATLAGMVTRADAILQAEIPLGELSLTAWQAVTNGTLLLHESEYGYEDAMRGRYAFVQDSPALMRAGLERLRQVLPEVGFAPSRVVAAPGRQSEILGRAAAQLLNLPYVAWEPGLESEGLVLAWTMESVENEDFLRALHAHHPEARLFVHASRWTLPFGYSPDFSTLLYQQITDPWTGGSLRSDPDTQEIVPAPPDERDADTLAAEILAAVPEEGVSSVELISQVARAMRPLPAQHQPGFLRSEGMRLRQWAGGPVLSNRFA